MINVTGSRGFRVDMCAILELSALWNSSASMECRKTLQVDDDHGKVFVKWLNRAMLTMV